MLTNRLIIAAICCSFSTALLAEITVVAPAAESTVSTLRPGQRDYLQLNSKERLRQLDDVAIRKQMLSIGADQQPIKLEWKGAKDETVDLSIMVLPDGKAESFSINGQSFAWFTNLELDREYRWTIKDSSSTATSTFRTEALPPRALRADGLSNFRDLGGWNVDCSGEKNVKVTKVRQGMIFRSAGLRGSSKREGGSMFAPKYRIGERRITDAGLKTLHDEFAIKTDIELRTDGECAGMNTTIIEDAKWVHIPFVAYDFIDGMARGKEPFAKLFHLFADRDNYPILMHCSGGRDRTGTLAFLLLGLLGVSEDDLVKDWEFSIFSDSGSKFNSAKIESLITYLNSMPGKHFNDKIETYVRGCGVTEEEIAAFRKIMLK